MYKSTYDLLLAIFRFTKDFGKEYKYTVGESLKKETIELLTLIYRANVKRDNAFTLPTAPKEIFTMPLKSKTKSFKTTNPPKKTK
ncbi:MAG: hypothetical protein ACOVOQ_17445 [Flavobacterium sp.]